jgi:hypothetical protein
MRPATFAFLVAALPALIAAAPLELETRQKEKMPGICLMICYDRKTECGKTGVSLMSTPGRMLIFARPSVMS